MLSCTDVMLCIIVKIKLLKLVSAKNCPFKNAKICKPQLNNLKEYLLASGIEPTYSCQRGRFFCMFVTGDVHTCNVI